MRDQLIAFTLCGLGLVAASGCSIRRIAVNSMASTLSESGETFASDDDPELIRDAIPFALKTYEALLAEVPEHEGLLLATCSGFTQYAYAFVQTDADLLDVTEFDRAMELRARALKLYLRARDYCLRALELEHPGIEQLLVTDPRRAVAAAKPDEVALLYWTGASWGAAVSLGLDRPELVADLPAVRALMDRALALDETYGEGAIHEALITLEAVPQAMGGSPERARRHFERAVELSKGRSAGPYVTLAASVSIGAQDRAEFVRLLEQALAIDPDAHPPIRLANLITQRRARHLLARVDELFAEPAPRESRR
jgi:predicted anti-sigma-YlaC factor YlaD